MNRIIKFNFGVINKIKLKQNLKKGIIRPDTPSHILNDVLNNASYQIQKNRLTPHQQFLIETRSMERPFTGKLWAHDETGFYHCVVCNTRLFTFDSKFKSKTGLATFWRCVQNRVTIIDDDKQVNFDNVNYARNKANLQATNYKRCECAQCRSHIGVVYFDGPPPSFLRYSINSSLLKFEQLPDFADPNILRKQKRLNYRASKQKLIG